MTKTLLSVIEQVPRYARATNIERDAGGPEAADYHLIEPSLDVLRRLAISNSRSLLITGPYGSGKSSFAVYLDALVGAVGDPATDGAIAQLRRADATLAASFDELRAKLWSDGEPVRAIATGRPESLPRTVLRALLYGTNRHSTLRRYGARIERELAGDPTPEVASRLYREIAESARVTLIVDELGVVLDAARDRADDGVWLFQELAENVARGSAVGFLVALQHRSLAEQLSGGREPPAAWRKIQGRFEEVPFVESRETVLSLVPRVLRRKASRSFETAVDAWAESQFEDVVRLGLEAFIPGGRPSLGQMYPLHPASLLVLPDLTTYYGQRERTLLAFLAGGEPYSMRPFLEAHSVDERPLPSAGLDQIYDFFVASGNHRLGTAARVSRWAEVERRISERDDLNDRQRSVAKAVALLNLVGRGGPARASEGVLEYASPGAKNVLSDLVADGLLVYRPRSDEYRIWRGSDLDLEASLESARAIAAQSSLAELLQKHAPLAPIVAASASESTGILRMFTRTYSLDWTTKTTADGQIIYDIAGGLGRDLDPDQPVLALHGFDQKPISEAALDVAALSSLLGQADIASDWVAQRELRDRHAVALDALLGSIDQQARSREVKVKLFLDGRSESLKAATLSRQASLAAQRAYPDAPHISNEMFSVDDLTSQGARARTTLFAAMIGHPDQETLGIQGWGPERAMYEAVFVAGGLHAPTRKAPFKRASDSTFAGPYDAMRQSMLSAVSKPVTVEDVLQSVEGRPYGLRRSLTPILWLAVSLALADEIAIFENGSLLPSLTIDAMERLVKAPGAFSVRAYAAVGARRSFIKSMSIELTGHDSTAMGLVRLLVRRVRALRPHALQSSNGLSDRAIGVRAAIVGAQEPAALLFETLPAAVGGSAIGSNGVFDSAIPRRIAKALLELDGAFRSLEIRVRERLAREFSVRDADELRTVLAARAEVLLAHTLEPRMRGFINAICEKESSDSEWLASLVLTIGAKPLDHWRDEDETLFDRQLREIAGNYARLTALYAFSDSRGRTQPFDARRITVTRPDGSEVTRTVWLSEADQSQIQRIVDGALESAQRWTGEDATALLIAALAERAEAKEPDVEHEPRQRASSK